MHHEFIWNTIAYAQRTLQLKDSDVTLAAPKLFFGYALASNMLFPFSVGGSCVLLPERVKAEDYFELLEKYQVTQFVTVPTTIAKMVTATLYVSRSRAAARWAADGRVVVMPSVPPGVMPQSRPP